MKQSLDSNGGRCATINYCLESALQAMRQGVHKASRRYGTHSPTVERQRGEHLLHLGSDTPRHVVYLARSGLEVFG